MTKKEDIKEKDYHGVAPIKSVVKKLKKEYDKDPKDWRLVGSSDKHGNSDTFIVKKPNTYWLKSKMLSPYSALSMGTVVKNLDKEIDEIYGGKKLSPNDMLRFFGMMVPIKYDQNVIAAGIEKYSQQHGDYLKKIINEKHANLGYKMARRVDEEFTRRYPLRKNLYI